jgi:carbamoyl-phosphate synthase small subunit
MVNNIMFENIKNKDAILMLQDGTIFFGRGIGAKGYFGGEICFNTSITGYQEILTDPSYYRQVICFTFPHIGNVGTNPDDYESDKAYAAGLVFGADLTSPSNYRSTETLHKWLVNNDRAGITGVDTRALTAHIRDNGAQNCVIAYADNLQSIDMKKLESELKYLPNMKGLELAKDVTTDKSYKWDQGTWNQDENKYNETSNNKYKVIALDFGIKKNILRNLAQAGCDVKVVPAETSAEEILKENPDGVFLSNGPGDPSQTVKYIKDVVQKIIDADIPVFGICLGHQILAEVLGCKTVKMHQGHRGANHPVKNIETNKVEITSQNHGFAVSRDFIPLGIKETHLSLFDNTNEGIAMMEKDVFSVQHHPEASPGPQDSAYIFTQFVDVMAKRSGQERKVS